MEQEKALETLSGPTPIADRYRAVKALSVARSVPAAARDARFEGALAQLGQDAAEAEGQERLLALASLMRLRAQLRSARDAARFEPHLRRALGRELPDLSSLEDPDDRAYCARALSFADESWSLPFLASFAVNEEAAESARSEAVAVLLEGRSADAALEALAASFERWEPRTQNPTETYAKRALRLLSSLEQHLLTARGATTASARAVSRLVRPRIRSTAPDVKREVADGLARGTLRLVHALVRLRFSLAVDARTYEPIASVRDWYAPHQWSKFVADAVEAQEVCGDLREAILILARQGRADRDLERRLELVLGGEAPARELLAGLALEGGVPETLRHRLATGSELAVVDEEGPGSLVQREQDAADAPLLGELLRIANEVQRASHVVTRDVLDELAILAESAVPPVRSLAVRARDLADSVGTLTRRRGLRLKGTPGETTEYSPHEHQLVGQQLTGVRWVRIVQPAVEQETSATGTFRIVHKALVEPAAAPA